MTTKFEVGEKVALTIPYAKQPSAIVTIEKVYKTGHAVIGSKKFRPSAYGFAHETGSGWSKSTIQKLTPEIEQAIRTENKKFDIRMIGAWLYSNARIGDVPDDMLAELIKIKIKVNKITERKSKTTTPEPS